MKVSPTAILLLLAAPAAVFATDHGTDTSGHADVAAFSKLSPDRSSYVANYEVRPTSRKDYSDSDDLTGVCAAEFGSLAIMADFNADIKAMTKEQYDLNLSLLQMPKLTAATRTSAGSMYWITLGGHATRSDGGHFMMQSFVDQDVPSGYW